MEKQENTNKIAGIIFIGFLFIGIGIGMAFEKVAIGTLIGMGAGFIVSAMYRSEKNK